MHTQLMFIRNWCLFRGLGQMFLVKQCYFIFSYYFAAWWWTLSFITFDYLLNQQLTWYNLYTHIIIMSQVWEVFSKTSADKGVCGTCDSVMSFKGGTTTVMGRHIERAHPDINLAAPKAGSKRTAADNSNLSQRKLKMFLASKTKLNRDSWRIQRLAKWL